MTLYKTNNPVFKGTSLFGIKYQKRYKLENLHTPYSTV